MKIVHLIWSFNSGGAENMLVDIINQQIENNIVDLIIINDTYDEELIKSIDKKVGIIYIKRKPSSKSVSFIFKLNYYLYKQNPDIIHCHNANIAKVIIPTFKNLCLTLHCSGISTDYLHKYKKIFAISNFVKEEITTRCNFDVDVVDNGINLERIQKRSDFSYENNLKIIQVSRLDKNIKGQDILIEAINILNRKGIKNVYVDFIGEGQSYEELKELTSRYSLDERIRFLGLRDRAYIYEHLKDYDLMCHPARNEGFGLVIIEALAARLPVLVPNQGGAYEIVRKGELATIFSNDDPDSCASKIIEIMNNYPKCLTVMQKSVEYVNRFSIRKTTEKYMYYYKELLD